MWSQQDEQAPFGDATAATRDPMRKNFSKDYLRFPEEQDFQRETRLPSTEPTGFQ